MKYLPGSIPYLGITGSGSSPLFRFRTLLSTQIEERNEYACETTDYQPGQR